MNRPLLTQLLAALERAHWINEPPTEDDRILFNAAIVAGRAELAKMEEEDRLLAYKPSGHSHGIPF